MQRITSLSNVSADRVSGPKLFIHVDAWSKMQAFVQASVPNEINGFGFVQQYDGNFYLAQSDDVVIIKQTVTPGTADNDGKDIAKLHYRAKKEGRQDQLRLQWHSHVYGKAYFSSTDTGTIDSFGDAGAEWLIWLVTNVRGDVEARYDQYSPIRIGVPIEVVLFTGANVDMLDDVQDKIDEHVTVSSIRRKAWSKYPNFSDDELDIDQIVLTS